jgi:hypothetical protein
VQDLTEMTAGSSLMTISVLHVMEARGFKNLERVMGVLARESGVPIISLSSFDFNFDAACLLPLDFMVRRGAVVFECLGQDALVAVLNPYDKQLRRDTQTLCARRCHFYLVLSSEFDRYVHRCKDLLDAKAAQEDAEPGGAAAAGER